MEWRIVLTIMELGHLDMIASSDIITLLISSSPLEAGTHVSSAPTPLGMVKKTTTLMSWIFDFGKIQHGGDGWLECEREILSILRMFIQVTSYCCLIPYGGNMGWVRDARSWELDVGGLSSRLYFYQDPGSKAAKRIWTSLDVGTEIFVSNKYEEAEWSVSDFDVISLCTVRLMLASL
ncbi:hypothetical protein L6452_31929 [Arctium lappa]|uniref:Uncharacterized protein n=1 Tax=Arctium lappa TaxID=4217 RepID=A0ACB8Z327_ARCLA|nr:hypothetical protein L6452_31929 [Arctium lappa]